MRRAGHNPVAVTDAEELMRMAIEATRNTYPHPNPRVGAVLMSQDGDVVSVAAHQGQGLPHAEVLAIGNVPSAYNATLFVSLEPCNHHAHTPPCTEAILSAGITRVFVGALDPDERVAGSGVERLRADGVDVTVGMLSDEVVANDPGYFHHRTTGLPLVTVKLATTLDGQAAARDGTSQWITSPEARMDAQELRSENDVVIVGAGTIIADDPLLTVRLPHYEGPQPRPVIIAGSRDIPSDRKILQRDPIIYRPHNSTRVDPIHVLEDLGERGYTTAMVEGGPAVASDFLRAKAVDRIVWYVGAKLAIGGGLPALSGVFETIGDATNLTITDVEQIGPDVRISAIIDREH